MSSASDETAGTGSSGSDAAARARRALAAVSRRLDDEGTATAVLLAAAAVSVALGLWVSRGATFANDEFVYFTEATDLSLRGIAEPYLGHLTAVHRALTSLYLHVFGSTHVPVVVTSLLVNAIVALLLFKLIARWVGSFAGLVAALPILFLGSTPVLIQGNTAMWGQAAMFGLAALLLLPRRSTAADALACAALALSVLSLELGLAFALAAAVWILLADRSPRRLWVAAVPLVLYAGWWAWAQQFDESFTVLSNVLLIPSFAADSAASALAALSGLGAALPAADGESIASVDPSWGRALLPLLLIALVVAVRRRGISPDLVAAAVLLLAAWAMLGLGYGESRTPDAARYAFAIVLGLLLLTAAAFAGSRPSPQVRAVMAIVLVASLAGNLWLLRDRGLRMRAVAGLNEVRLAAVELHPERARAAGGLVAFTTAPASPDAYLRAAAEFGGLGAEPGAIAGLRPALRAEADAALGRLAPPAAEETDERCAATKQPTVTVGPAGTHVRVEEGRSLVARRFADAPSVPVAAPPGAESLLITAPADAAPQPWVVSVTDGAPIEVCGPPPGESE